MVLSSFVFHVRSCRWAFGCIHNPVDVQALVLQGFCEVNHGSEAREAKVWGFVHAVSQKVAQRIGTMPELLLVVLL